MNRKGTYSDENNHLFVEFVKAERFHDEEDAEGLWFAELIKEGGIGLWHQNATKEELIRKRALLASWGYGEDSSITGKQSTTYFPSYRLLLLRSDD